MAPDLKALFNKLPPGDVIKLATDPNAAKTLEGLSGLASNPILAALLQWLLGYLNKPDVPVQPPVVIQPPQPPVVVFPPTVPPAVPFPPARPAETSLLAGFSQAYHSWFKGDEANEVPPGNASPEENEAIRRGRSPLPPESRIIVDADPQPTDCVERPFPAFVITLRGVSGQARTDRLTQENPEGELFSIQAPDRPDGVYLRSTGHRLIIKCPKPSERSSIEFFFDAGDGILSNTVLLPWVARG